MGGSPIPKSKIDQQVNIFVNNKNAPEDLKHKINTNFFCLNDGFPKGGRGVMIYKKGLQDYIICIYISILWTCDIWSGRDEQERFLLDARGLQKNICHKYHSFFQIMSLNIFDMISCLEAL